MDLNPVNHIACLIFPHADDKINIDLLPLRQQKCACTACKEWKLWKMVNISHHAPRL